MENENINVVSDGHVAVWSFTFDVKKLSDAQLREFKIAVNEEIRVRELGKEDGGKATSKLNNILWRDTWSGGNRFGFTEEEKFKTLSEMTEEEFSHWSGVGKATIIAAKTELAKRGLKFSVPPLTPPTSKQGK